MSSIYMEICVKPKDSVSLIEIETFSTYVNENKFSDIEKIDKESFLGELDDISRYFDSGLESKTEDGIFYINFENYTSFDYETFQEFLSFLGACEIEMYIFNSQVGEDIFYKNGEQFDDYKETDWKWLKNPNPDFEGEFVVFTGTFEDYERSALDEVIEEYEGTVQKSVNSKTTLLVIGRNPDNSKLSKADELGVKTINEETFFNIIES